MRILLTGATGFIGKHILKALLVNGHEVTACVRKPGALVRQHPGITEVQCDYKVDVDSGDWMARLRGIDVVINAVGIISEHKGNRFEDLHTRAPIALFTASEQQGVRKVIQISALGADGNASSAYHLSKRKADEHLMSTQLDWTVLRPSVVYGAGGQSTAFFRAMAGLPVVPLIAGGKQQIQPIAIEDLVKIVLAALDNERLSKKVLEVAGPEPMSFKNYLSLQRQWLGLSGCWFVSIPYRLALLAGAVAGALGSVLLNRETVSMLQRGNCADITAQVEATGIVPRSVRSSLDSTPATKADVWFAQLFFLGPVLRLAIAFVWILTGLVSIWGYPVEQSYELLGQVGLPSFLNPMALYGAAMMDIAIGVLLLINWRPRLVALMQISIILVYMSIISVALPEHWLHPFGPISKNVPLLVAIWVTAILSEKR